MSNHDYFLKIDGIEGESKDAKHKGEIDIEAYDFSVYQSASQVRGFHEEVSGKVMSYDLVIRMNTNKASPKLMLACATGAHFPGAIVTGRMANNPQQEFLKITLGEILISNFERGESKDGANVMDRVALSYTKIEMEYREPKADGSLGPPVKVGYDIIARAKM